MLLYMSAFAFSVGLPCENRLVFLDYCLACK